MNTMRALKWKAIAWAALVCGLIATPPHATAAPQVKGAAHPAILKTSPGVTTHHPGTATTHHAGNNMAGNNTGIHHMTSNTAGISNTGFRNTLGNNNGNANNNAYSQTVTALHQAHTLLANADHDYNGHRAKAAEHISHAIRELGGQHHANGGTNGGTRIFGATIGGNKGHGNGAKAGGANGNRMREPQAQSDAQLQKALGLIEGVSGHVSNTHKASQHIQSAVAELSTALQVR